MTRTTLFRICILLIGSIFFMSNANAQSNMSSKKKKEKAKKETTVKVDEDQAQEEIEYYWSYTVMEVVGKSGEFNIILDKNVFNSDLKMRPEEIEIAKKAAAGGLTFNSEMEFLAFMTNQDYELVSVVNVNNQNIPALKMYFRKQLEK